jgi:hypothetical protein
MARKRKAFVSTLVAVLVVALAACSGPLRDGIVDLGEQEAVTLGGGSFAFKLGSLIAEGTLWGLGKVVFDDNPEILMTASAKTFERICFNKGGGGLPAVFNADLGDFGASDLDADEITRRGKSDFEVIASTYPVWPASIEDFPLAPVADGEVAWRKYNCPNSNWTPRITFVFWDAVKIETTGTDKTNEYFFACNTWKTYTDKNMKVFEAGIVCDQVTTE